jgi:HEAT repeat protein
MDIKFLRDIPPWEWPEAAGKMLGDILRNERAAADDRLLAAELAGEFTVISDELVDALLAVLRGGAESELRASAAIALGPVLEHVDMQGFEDVVDIPIAEGTFHRIQESLRKLYMDVDVPADVRRRILEASVRAPQEWHREAVGGAYSSHDEAWRLTGVFCMRFIRGFDAEILEALGSRNPDIHYEAVCAAGTWQVDAAWPHIAALVRSKETDKPLLLAAIEAIGGIRPKEAAAFLDDLIDSDDEDIAGAVAEAIAMAEGLSDEDDEGPGR